MEKPRVPEPRSDSRPAGSRMAGVFRWLKDPGETPKPLDPKPVPPEAVAEGKDESNVDAAIASKPESAPAEDPPTPERADRGTEGETSQADYETVKVEIRKLQVKDKCPDCFPLNDEKLKRLAGVVHGLAADDNAEEAVLEELQKIAGENSPFKNAA
jgi:hypothetical protein